MKYVHTKPRPYQRRGVQLIRRFRGRAILADDPGLGKTPQTLWWVRDHMSPGNVVVVVQANLKVNWARETWTHIRRKVNILDTRTPAPFPKKVPKHEIFVINYDILGRPGKGRNTWLNWLRKLKPRCVILDEIQMIKSREAVRTKACRELCRGVKHVLALGGTGGLENCPAELFPVLNILWPEKYPSFRAYGDEFCGPKKTHWGVEYKGATNLPKLHAQLKANGMIRRRKEDVLKDLPKVTRIVVPVGLPPKLMEEYRKAENDFARWLRTSWFTRGKRKKGGALSASRLAKMSHLKELCGKLKLDFVAEWLQTFRHENPNRKVLVFGWHKAFLRELHRRFPASVLLTGDVPQAKRQIMTDKFNLDKECPEFFGNMQAAGAGWSCTSSSTTIMGEFPWNPALLKQAGGRNHGLGRGIKGEPNFEYWMTVKGTIEEKIVSVLERKQSVIDQVLDGAAENVSPLDVINQITDLYREERK